MQSNKVKPDLIITDPEVEILLLDIKVRGRITKLLLTQSIGNVIESCKSLVTEPAI